MRLGILDALSSNELDHVTWHGSTAGTYIEFLRSAGAPFTYMVYQVSGGEFPQEIDECDAYLITGSIKGTYDDEPWIGSLMQFIQRGHGAGKQMVGICFGHQILAHSLGGRSEKSEKGWGLGLKSFDVVADKAWMNGRPASCSLYFSHQDQVVRLPPGAERLGSSEFCENALFAMGKQVLGIQGHPEFTREIMQEILARPKATASPELMETAVRSLENGRPDNDLLAQWIISFLTE